MSMINYEYCTYLEQKPIGSSYGVLVSEKRYKLIKATS